MPRPEVSLVIPIFNEEEVLPQLDARLLVMLDKLGVSAEVVFVDDGSKDGSLGILRTMVTREPRYRALSFARNFGHQRAITCGMDATRGKAVVVMDADLQDPPEVVIEMLAKWREGYDVVYGKRRTREGETWFKLFTAKIFYRLFAAMIPVEVPLDAGDFRLMSRRVIVAMRELRETHRFVRGLVAWVGFKQTAVEYDRAARAAGETKYPLRKMLAFAFDGIASFSIFPLRLATYLGLLVGTASVLYALSAIFAHVGLNATVPGWTTTVVLVSLLFSVQLVVTGVLGEYVGRIYEEVKGRPLYIVGERLRHPRMRKRLSTADFESIGEAARMTDRPMVGGAPPPASGAAPGPVPQRSAPPPPLPTKAAFPKPGDAGSARPPPVQPKPSPPAAPAPAASTASPPAASTASPPAASTGSPPASGAGSPASTPPVFPVASPRPSPVASTRPWPAASPHSSPRSSASPASKPPPPSGRPPSKPPPSVSGIAVAKPIAVPSAAEKEDKAPEKDDKAPEKDDKAAEKGDKAPEKGDKT